MIQPGKPIQDISITKESSLEKIFEQMSKSGGFESRNLADGLDVLTVMIKDNDCLIFVICRCNHIHRIKGNNKRHDKKQMVRHCNNNMWSVRP